MRNSQQLRLGVVLAATLRSGVVRAASSAAVSSPSAAPVSVYPSENLCVVLNEGCWQANPGLPGCSESRGTTFIRNQSTTWSTDRLDNGGLYALNTPVESLLGLDGAAYYGFDTVNLGIAGQDLPELKTQVVAGIGTDNFWLGTLGLSPRSFNFTSINDPVPSVLGSLVNGSYVPGTSWAYTAGAFYSSPQVYGSLIFGGYDATRMDMTNTLSNIAFSADTDRDLIVKLQSITYNTIGSTTLQSTSIYVFIDSLVPQLWLPLETCQRFERAFNLTWDDTESLYILDESTHSKLLAQNPSFTFTLGASGGTETIEITLPYAAFDLNLTMPTLPGQYRYFPLQRAQNATQYTLGRVFLQEAYVITDYDRENFTIAQAMFPPTSVKPRLVSICSPDNESICSGGASHKLSGGAIAGIVVGAVFGLGLIAVGLLRIWRSRLKRRKPKDDPKQSSSLLFDEKPEAEDGTEVDAEATARHEMDQSHAPRPELAQNDKALRSELAGNRPLWPELADSAASRPQERYELMDARSQMPPINSHEMPTGQVAAAELAGI